MKTFHCNRCSQLVFFENVRCERCEALLGYLPELAEISAFVPAEDTEAGDPMVNSPAGVDSTTSGCAAGGPMAGSPGTDDARGKDSMTANPATAIQSGGESMTGASAVSVPAAGAPMADVPMTDAPDRPPLWRSLHPDAHGRLYRMCDNYAIQNVCNWMIPADLPDKLCRSCELTTVIPNLSLPDNHLRWYKLETAKRRLLYTLAALRLPIEPKPAPAEPLEPLEPAQTEPPRAEPLEADSQQVEPLQAEPSPSQTEPSHAEPSHAEPSQAEPSQAVPPQVELPQMAPPPAEPISAQSPTAPPTIEAGAPASGVPDSPPPAIPIAPAPDLADGVAFEFLEDTQDGEPVMTGHDNGRITLNIAEADDARREQVREQMHEPYRTLLGHFRHEIGHYYFDRLIAGTQWNAPFRTLFGDERADYGEALQHHYRDGPPTDWWQSYISAYASTHPWEDWAETWAHYLHMVDTLDTATSCGLSLLPDDPDAPTLTDTTPVEDAGFDNLLKRWYPLTYALNSLNRSLGMPDSYPFMLPSNVVEKLRFVHRVIAAGVMPKIDVDSNPDIGPAASGGPLASS